MYWQYLGKNEKNTTSTEKEKYCSNEAFNCCFLKNLNLFIRYIKFWLDRVFVKNPNSRRKVCNITGEYFERDHI